MKIKSDREIYTRIEDILRAQGSTPATCTEIYDSHFDLHGHIDLRKQTDGPMSAEERRRADIGRLSDYMGHMWRRGLLTRHTSPGGGSNGQARYSYTLKECDHMPQRLPDPETLSHKTIRKQQIEITETDRGLIIELEDFQLLIRRK